MMKACIVIIVACIAAAICVGIQSRTHCIYSYYPDGQVQAVSTLDSHYRRQGPEHRYNEDGTLFSYSYYVNDICVQSTTYWPSGRVRQTSVEQADHTMLHTNYPDRD